MKTKHQPQQNTTQKAKAKAKKSQLSLFSLLFFVPVF
jgi:hypothetical protein